MAFHEQVRQLKAEKEEKTENEEMTTEVNVAPLDAFLHSLEDGQVDPIGTT